MRIKKNISLSDTGFVFNPSTGESFSVNPIGAEILKLLKEGKDHGQIKAAIIEHYQTDEATIDRDLDDFVNMMKHYLLTENDE